MKTRDQLEAELKQLEAERDQLETNWMEVENERIMLLGELNYVELELISAKEHIAELEKMLNDK